MPVVSQKHRPFSVNVSRGNR